MRRADKADNPLRGFFLFFLRSVACPRAGDDAVTLVGHWLTATVGSEQWGYYRGDLIGLTASGPGTYIYVWHIQKG